MTRNFKIFANQFVPFLAAHRAFGRYVSNFVDNFPHMHLDRFIDSTVIDCWILCAFNFDDTLEGLDFWVRMNKEWQAVVSTFNLHKL